MTEAPMVCVSLCDRVHLCVFERRVTWALWTLQLSVPRQHQGAIGVFNMQMIADQ